MKPMAKGLVIRALTLQGCLKLSDEGKHEKWGCPEKSHLAQIPQPSGQPGAQAHDRSHVPGLTILPAG